MKAMIFAAGLGSRLKPLTNNKPKALVELNGKTLLEIQIQKLIRSGFDELVINVHHFSEMIIEFLNKHDFGIPIHISNEADQLLDTGGGLLKAGHYLGSEKPFLVHNVDVVSDLNLKDLYDFHIKTNALATLAVKNRETSRYLLFNEQLELCGWENIRTGEKIIVHDKQPVKPFAFSGIHVINPEIFKMISSRGKFSIIPEYLRLAKNNKIIAYRHDDVFWMDVGKPDELQKIQNRHF